jgi:CheY-like chemotaxis protein
MRLKVNFIARVGQRVRLPEHIGVALRLCAEDDQNVALILKFVLENEGHHVECVDDGRAALGRSVADLRSFDLVITDHHMPFLSGLQLVEKLREAKFLERIIVHRANLRQPAADAYRAFAVDRILGKPAHLAELLETVHGTAITPP